MKRSNATFTAKRPRPRLLAGTELTCAIGGTKTYDPGAPTWEPITITIDPPPKKK